MGSDRRTREKDLFARLPNSSHRSIRQDRNFRRNRYRAPLPTRLTRRVTTRPVKGAQAAQLIVLCTQLAAWTNRSAASFLPLAASDIEQDREHAPDPALLRYFFTQATGS